MPFGVQFSKTVETSVSDWKRIQKSAEDELPLCSYFASNGDGPVESKLIKLFGKYSQSLVSSSSLESATLQNLYKIDRAMLGKLKDEMATLSKELPDDKRVTVHIGVVPCPESRKRERWQKNQIGVTDSAEEESVFFGPDFDKWVKQSDQRLHKLIEKKNSGDLRDDPNPYFLGASFTLQIGNGDAKISSQAMIGLKHMGKPMDVHGEKMFLEEVEIPYAPFFDGTKGPVALVGIDVGSDGGKVPITIEFGAYEGFRDGKFTMRPGRGGMRTATQVALRLKGRNNHMGDQPAQDALNAKDPKAYLKGRKGAWMIDLNVHKIKLTVDNQALLSEQALKAKVSDSDVTYSFGLISSRDLALHTDSLDKAFEDTIQLSIDDAVKKITIESILLKALPNLFGKNP